LKQARKIQSNSVGFAFANKIEWQYAGYMLKSWDLGAAKLAT